MKITITDLEKMQPCREGLEFARQHASLSDAWAACQRPNWMFWLLERSQSLTKIQSVTLAIRFARQSLEIFERAYPGDKRPMLAIEAAECWIANPTAAARDAARDAAYASAWSAARKSQCDIIREIVGNPFVESV